MYKLEKTKIIYKIDFYQLENLNVEWSFANSICENFTFGIKIREHMTHSREQDNACILVFSY